MAQPKIPGNQLQTGTGIGDIVQIESVGSPQIPTLPAVDGSQLIGVSGNVSRNRVDNGGMSVNQRGFQVSVINAYQLVDRYKLAENSTSVLSCTQNTDVSPGEDDDGKEPTTSMRLDVTTADAALGATEYSWFHHGIMVADLEDLYDEEVTVSFRVKSNKVGTFCVAIQNTASDHYYISEHTIDSADTWEKKSFTFTLDTTQGSWAYASRLNKAIRIYFVLGSGTTYASGTADIWNSGILLATANQDNYLDNTANYFEITALKLEEGNEATSFIDIPFDIEYDKAQMFWQQSYEYGTEPTSITNNGAIYTRQGFFSISNLIAPIPYAKRMRGAPSIVFYSDVTGASGNIRNVSGGSDVSVSSVRAENWGHTQLVVGSTINAGQFVTYHWVADANV